MPTLIDPTRDNPYAQVVAEDRNIIEKAILAEYRHRRLNPYKLWKLVEGDGVSRSTIYAFVNGKTSLSTQHAAHLMIALGIGLNRPKK